MELGEMERCQSVTLCAFLSGVSSFNYNYDQNNYSFGNVVPDFCVVRSIQFIGTQANNTGAAASPAGGNTILIWSDIVGNIIGTIVPSWVPNPSTPAFNVTSTASSNPNSVLDLKGRTITTQSNFQFFTSSASTSNPFGITPATLTGQLSLTLDFIKLKKRS